VRVFGFGGGRRWMHDSAGVVTDNFLASAAPGKATQ